MTTPRAILALALMSAAVLAAAGRGVAQPAGELPSEIQDVGVTERLGESVALGTPFTNSAGEAVTLGDYFDGERPVVLVFAYHSCPMLCSLILDATTAAMAEADLDLGEDYRVVAVSFDPADTPERAAAAKERYVRRLDDADAAAAYAFLTGSADAIARLTGDVGFRYEWVERQQEFAHTASLIFLSPEGEVTRYLYGIEYPARDFRTAVLEAGQGRIGSPVDQLILYCFAYDPDAGSYVLHATNAMKVAGLATVLLLGLGLLFFWRREGQGNRAALGDDAGAVTAP